MDSVKILLFSDDEKLYNSTEKEHCRKVTGKILGVILIAAGCCTTLGMKKYISLIALTALTVFISQCIGIIKYKVEKEKN